MATRWEAAMKSVRLTGEVVRHEVKNVQRIVKEGDDEHMVEQEVFILVVEDDDGHRVRLQRGEGPWDVMPGEDVTVTLAYGAQTTLEDERPATKKKA